MKLGNEWRVAAKAAVIVLGVWAGLQFGVAAVWSTGGTTSFEEKPQDTGFVSGGALKIRETRNEVRRRADVEHDWSTINVGDLDSGRHRKGSARAFFQAGSPATMPYPDTNGASSVLDDGRLWVDSDDNSLWVNTSASSANWVGTGVPTGTIILWDNTTGCAGAPNVCPCGYSEVIAFRNLAIRGADSGTARGDIPDTPGVTCDAGTTTYGTGCTVTGAAFVYSDTQTDLTLAPHRHGMDMAARGSVGSAAVIGGGTSVFSQTVGGGADNITAPWPGPFRTVLFCKKT